MSNEMPMVRPFRHWAFRDRYGWPVERIIGRPITNFIRLILHADIVQSCRRTEPHCSAPLRSVDARYCDLLQRLGCCSHDGAIKEIGNLRRIAGLDEPNTRLDRKEDGR